jgi:hypothetical protein
VLLKLELNAEPDAATRSLAVELRSAQPPTVEKVAERRLDINQDTKRALTLEHPWRQSMRHRQPQPAPSTRSGGS